MDGNKSPHVKICSLNTISMENFLKYILQIIKSIRDLRFIDMNSSFNEDKERTQLHAACQIGRKTNRTAVFATQTT